MSHLDNNTEQNSSIKMATDIGKKGVKTASRFASRKVGQTAASVSAKLLQMIGFKYIAITMVAFLFISILTELLPAVVWNEITHIDETLANNSLLTSSVDVLLTKEEEILDAIYGSLEKDYSKVYSNIKSQCDSLSADYQMSISAAKTPASKKSGNYFQNEGLNFTEEEWEAVVLYSAYSLSINQLQGGFHVDENGKFINSGVLDGKSIGEDISEKVQAYLDKDSSSYYSVDYARNNDGTIKVLTKKIEHVDPETEEKKETEISYIVPVISTISLENLYSEIFPVDMDKFTEKYGEDASPDQVITELAMSQLALLHSKDVDKYSASNKNKQVQFIGEYNKKDNTITVTIKADGISTLKKTVNVYGFAFTIYDEVGSDAFNITGKIMPASNSISFSGKINGTDCYADGKLNKNKFNTFGVIGEGAESSYLYPLDPKWRTVTSKYGNRVHPITHALQFHTGIDIGDSGINKAPVYASQSGTVTYAGVNGGYGNVVMIKHTDGYTTTYAHLSSISVKKGETVARGDVVGKVGSTGRSTGPHLHYEILNPSGYYINPTTKVNIPSKLISN